MNDDCVAIVGMAFRLPGGVNDTDALWSFIAEGRTAFEERTLLEGGAPIRGAFIERADEFDHEFFSMSPGEARSVDPQQLLMLECVWRCIESAGYSPAALLPRRTGVFMAASGYDQFALLPANASRPPAGLCDVAPSLLANRISFFFNCQGPSVVVDTACSSSLVALHQGMAAVRAGECDQVLVGAVNLIQSSRLHDMFSEMGQLSPSGVQRPFEARADGYVRGEGVVALLIKPLALALRDRDHVYAEIAGSAVVHGGRALSLTAPNPNSQIEAIATACARAGVAASRIGVVEGHGTATALGDAIEMTALRSALDSGAERLSSCYLGCLKANFGHLEAASGLAGVVKLVACLERGMIASLAGFEVEHPDIAISASRFVIPTRPEPWPVFEGAEGKPRQYAGVSAFGLGGVAAHVVIKGATKAQSPSGAPTGEHLVVLSARDPDALRSHALHLSRHVGDRGEELSLANLAYTLHFGRCRFSHRLAIVAGSCVALVAKLQSFAAGHAAENVYYKDASAGAPRQTKVTAALRQSIEGLTRDRDLARLALLWVSDVPFPAEKLYDLTVVRRIPLPGHDFAKASRDFEGVRRQEEATERGPSAGGDIRLKNGDAAGDGQSLGEDALQARLLAFLLKCLPEATGVDESRSCATFSQFGLKSAALVAFCRKLQAALNIRIPPALVFHHTTPSALARHLCERHREELGGWLAASEPQGFAFNNGCPPTRQAIDGIIASALLKLSRNELSIAEALRIVRDRL